MRLTRTAVQDTMKAIAVVCYNTSNTKQNRYFSVPAYFQISMNVPPTMEDVQERATILLVVSTVPVLQDVLCLLIAAAVKVRVRTTTKS